MPHVSCVDIVTKLPLARILGGCACGALFAGCSVHTNAEIAGARSKGISSNVAYKLEHRGFFRPSDLIELKKRGVDDGLVIDHLEKVGINYVARPDNLKVLRSEGVAPDVVDALVRASDRFNGNHRARGYYGYDPYYSYWPGPYYYPYGPYYGPGPAVEVDVFRGGGWHHWR